MGFLDIHLKLKTFRIRRLLNGRGGREEKSKLSINGIRPSWMMPISHGYRSVENRSFGAEPDLVVAQREQIQENELWLFGIFDTRIGDGVSKYIEAHLFDQKLKESHMRKKSKDTLRKAHLNVRANIREAEKSEETLKLSSATAIVINGEKLLVANMGDYKAVLCRDGKAYQIREKQGGFKRHWSGKFIPGAFRRSKVRLLFRGSGNARVIKPSKSSEIVVGSHRIDYETEFVILGNSGIWEVMKYQEAVSLIRHIDDPQEAAECLAKEAMTRMTKNIISCLIIRFD